VGSANDIRLMLEAARELVNDLLRLSCDLEAQLDRGVSIDEVILLLQRKKERVDTLKHVCIGIKSELNVDQTGQIQIPIPEDIKISFGDLMMSFQRLIDTESELERLLCSKGIPISGGTK